MPMFDQLVHKVAETLSQVKDHRKTKPEYSLKDCLMGGFAMFALKDPSLLAFVNNYPARKSNLKQVFKIEQIPSENGLRNIIDPVQPLSLLPCFQTLINEVEAIGLLEQYRYLNNYFLLSLDGTGHFSSNCISCPQCMVKERKKDNGEISKEYYHQMLSACIVHPHQKAVFPVFAEAITKQDGATKNDCERNAAKRFLPHIRTLLPHQKLIILLDALYADGPTIKHLQSHQADFITVIKEGYVLVQVERLKEKKEALSCYSWIEKRKKKNIVCSAKWVCDLTLNGSHPNLKVNYIEYKEYDQQTGKTIYTNKWISSLSVDENNIEQFVKAARCRWKIENETFNTLKNQGYHFEHNYGHGKKNLSTVLALLMLLAFFVDQITAATDEVFSKALTEANTLRDLREKVRVLFDLIPSTSMELIYKIIAREVALKPSQ